MTSSNSARVSDTPTASVGDPDLGPSLAKNSRDGRRSRRVFSTCRVESGRLNERRRIGTSNDSPAANETLLRAEVLLEGQRICAPPESPSKSESLPQVWLTSIFGVADGEKRARFRVVLVTVGMVDPGRVEGRRTPDQPWTQQPSLSSSSARHEPSCPVISARFMSHRPSCRRLQPVRADRTTPSASRDEKPPHGDRLMAF